MPDDNATAERGEPRSLTTRRGFIAATSLGAVSLYGLWAAYGAAPFRLFGDGQGAEHKPAADAAGHGGHGAASGPTVDEFRHQTEAFIARHRQADGSVQVDAAPPATPASVDHGAHGASHDLPAMSDAVTTSTTPADIYLLAQQWSFEPAVLRLRSGTPYRFRMMAVDASHGASLQLGKGSRIIRLRQGAVVEQELTFVRPGEYLVYCTLYCGVGHDRMSGRIIVTRELS